VAGARAASAGENAERRFNLVSAKGGGVLLPA